MKTFAEFRNWLIIPILFICIPAIAEKDSTGLPGDHLDLRAALELFKKSKSLEEFEKNLNTKDQRVNNLDLNADGKVDYLRVYDIKKDDVHAIVIQDPVSEKESQDVAVIEIEKKGNESAAILIRGDEEIYGDDYVVAPKEDKSESSPEPKFGRLTSQTVVFVNVWYWPCVQYVYYPSYVVWVSPWYWGYYPWWWYPWPPYPYYTYYGWTVVYYDYYYCCAPVYVLHEAHSVYQPRRVVSSSVHDRYAGAQAAHREAQKKKADQQAPRPAGDAKPGEQQRKGEPQQGPRQEEKQKQKGQPAPKPREDVQPKPVPAPAPRPAPNPRPPRVDPMPRPVPAPPRPVPSPPRPTPVPRPR